MPTSEEITIIEGLCAGGTERERFENMLWKLFSHFINWGIVKYRLPKDEVREAYNDAILCVIINIVTGSYKKDDNTLLKTYAEIIFIRVIMKDELPYIDRYFTGELSTEEKKTFEGRCLADPAFARMVAFYISLQEHSPQQWEERKREQFAQLEAETFFADESSL